MNKLLLYLFVVINIIFLSSCSRSVENKTSEQMCVEAQMKLFDKAEKGSKQREYFNTAFKNKDAYNAWAWRQCMKKYNENY